MPRVSCSVCSKLFDAKRSTAKFCGGTCRQRANRSASETAEKAAPTLEIAPKPRIHPLISRTTEELEGAGVLDTVMGQNALILAEKLVGKFDTGSATASLSKEFRSVMQQALSSGTKKADGLDELAARRLNRASGA